ncbi:type VI secretion system baseplate subunit TssE [Xylophilus sp. Kf1]|nr:type VI secretion system baseplate subunit TssE [Xylophilus sp. Kf1]
MPRPSPPAIGTAPRRARLSLLPTLFDRLQDDEPSRSSESPTAYAHTVDSLRQSVRRDLAFLLNAVNPAGSIDPVTHPDAARSCLNFGIRPLVGRPLDHADWKTIEELIRDAIERFEPRLDKATLAITPLYARRSALQPPASDHLLRFEIRADIRTRPYPLEFLVQSAIDLETCRLGAFA